MTIELVDGKAGVAKHLEMLRHRGLRDAELGANDRDNLARRLLPERQQFEDATPDRIAEYIEGVHGSRNQTGGWPV